MQSLRHQLAIFRARSVDDRSTEKTKTRRTSSVDKKHRSPDKTSTQRLFVKRKKATECVAETKIENKSVCREKTHKSIAIEAPVKIHAERIERTIQVPEKKPDKSLSKSIKTNWNYMAVGKTDGFRGPDLDEPGPSALARSDSGEQKVHSITSEPAFPVDEMIEKMFEPLRDSVEQLRHSTSPEKAKLLGHTPSVRLRYWKAQLHGASPVKTRDHSEPPIHRLSIKPRAAQTMPTTTTSTSPRLLHTSHSATNALETMEHRTLRDGATRPGTWQPLAPLRNSSFSPKTPVEFVTPAKMYQHEPHVIRPVAYRPRVLNSDALNHNEFNRNSFKRPDREKEPLYANDYNTSLTDILSMYQIVDKDLSEMNASTRSNFSVLSTPHTDQGAPHKSLLTTISSSSSGIHVTPSPSDSGIIEFENLIRDKELELREIRSRMEQNEEIIIKVYQEKEVAWKKELEGLQSRVVAAEKGEKALREQLSNCQRQTNAMSECMRTLQDEKKTLVKQCMKLEQEIEHLRSSASFCPNCLSQRTGKGVDLRWEVNELREEVASLKRAVDKQKS